MVQKVVRVVHYMDSLRARRGGTVRALLDLAQGTAAAGWDVRVLAHDLAADEPHTAALWTQLEASHSWPRLLPDGGFRPRHLAEAAAVVAQADVLHVHSVWSYGAHQLARVAEHHRVPYIVTSHGVLDDWSMSQKPVAKRAVLGLYARRTLAGAAAIHCTAEGEREQASRWVPHSRVAVIPYVMDLGPYRQLPGVTGQRTGPEIRLLFLSRLHVKKGVDLFLDSLALLRDRGIPFQAKVAGSADEGSDYEHHLRKQAAALKLQNVEFIGFVDGAAKLDVYRHADVFVLPTSQENFGFVSYEALASGTAVITTRGVDTWQELENSGGALIVERTADACARAVERLARRDPDPAELGVSGRAWVLEHLDETRTVGSFLELYSQAQAHR